jgi:signal transduction histidine kinase
MTSQTQNTACMHILHLEDSELDHALVTRELVRSGERFDIHRVETLAAFSAALEQTDFSVVLADYRLNGFTALDAWQIMQTKSYRVPFVLLSGAIGESAAVRAIKAGISDYLAKDELGKLWRVLTRAIEMNRILMDKEIADRDLSLSEQRLSRFTEHLQETIEQERAAIAREIHDDIGGSLAAIRFDLAWIGRHTDNAGVQSHVAAAGEMLTHAIHASQRIMVNLRPAVLDQGLIAAIHWLASDFSKRTGIPATVDAPAHLDGVPKPKLLVAYRTTQEALTNVSKYAQCSKVRIELSDAENFLTLEIADDGCGMSPESLSKASSYGIRGLRERARTVGGWLDVSSQLGQGTALILSIPLGTTESTQGESAP